MHGHDYVLPPHDQPLPSAYGCRQLPHHLFGCRLGCSTATDPENTRRDGPLFCSNKKFEVTSGHGGFGLLWAGEDSQGTPWPTDATTITSYEGIASMRLHSRQGRLVSAHSRFMGDGSHVMSLGKGDRLQGKDLQRRFLSCKEHVRYTGDSLQASNLYLDAKAVLPTDHDCFAGGFFNTRGLHSIGNNVASMTIRLAACPCAPETADAHPAFIRVYWLNAPIKRGEELFTPYPDDTGTVSQYTYPVLLSSMQGDAEDVRIVTNPYLDHANGEQHDDDDDEEEEEEEEDEEEEEEEEKDAGELEERQTHEDAAEDAAEQEDRGVSGTCCSSSSSAASSSSSSSFMRI